MGTQNYRGYTMMTLRKAGMIVNKQLVSLTGQFIQRSIIVITDIVLAFVNILGNRWSTVLSSPTNTGEVFLASCLLQTKNVQHLL